MARADISSIRSNITPSWSIWFTFPPAIRTTGNGTSRRQLKDPRTAPMVGMVMMKQGKVAPATQEVVDPAAIKGIQKRSADAGHIQDQSAVGRGNDSPGHGRFRPDRSAW